MGAMRAMKKGAMKRAMKAAAPKAMRAMKKKVISARLAKRHAFFGKLSKTTSGLTKSDLVKNKSGKIVSKKRSAFAKKSPWLAAVKQARATLKIKGFCAIKKGTPLYKEEPMAGSRQAGTCHSEDQGVLRCEEGHSSLQ